MMYGTEKEKPFELVTDFKFKKGNIVVAPFHNEKFIFVTDDKVERLIEQEEKEMMYNHFKFLKKYNL